MPVAVPSFDNDYSAKSFLADPFPMLEEYRSAGPVTFHTGMNWYMLTGYRDIAKVLGDAKRFTTHVEMIEALFGGSVMQTLDNPRHAEFRSIWNDDFRRAYVENHQQLITRIVDEQLNEFLASLSANNIADAVAPMTRVIPTRVIAQLLGVPEEDTAQFIQWSDAMGGVTEGPCDLSPRGAEVTAIGLAATAELNSYMKQALEDRRQSPGDDLISRLVVSPVAKTMSEAEQIASNTQLVFAGNETTTKLMSLIMIALARHPEQRQLLLEDRSLIPSAIEEIHRFTPVVSFLHRIVRADDVEIQGVPLPKGSVITCWISAAHRDPSRYENPNELDVRRASTQHLGFGIGMRNCLGQSLSRVEIEIWLNRLLDELPDWSIPDEIDWGTNYFLRGPVSLPVSTPANKSQKLGIRPLRQSAN